MTLEELQALKKTEADKGRKFKHHVNVCIAASCASCNSNAVKEALEAEVKTQGLGKTCKITGVGCMGLCSQGPLVTVESDGQTPVLYQTVAPTDAPAVLASFEKGPLIKLQHPLSDPFFSKQVKLVLENSGKIDPERIEDYIAAGGYEALYNVLMEMSPAEVIEQMVKSGLRGRGGAGYPTGLKWSTVSKANGAQKQKYVICNADEGDPGAFMDRSVLESDPHRVLEGMAIAAYAVGADRGYIYVRGEYPLAVKHLQKAIRQSQRMGILGAAMFETHHNFTVELRIGAGAFVCGEETALIASVEGGRGVPRPRPPYPAEYGLWGSPTLINNVETYANVPIILRKGGEWYGQYGTEKSKGTKVFALAGRVKNTGLVEVPMGITIREIVNEVGGGVSDGGVCKAVQTGGPSGGCIPAQHFDTPVDFESLGQLGSIMGSGGMIIMDEKTCMVDVAKYFMDFCRSESCGKCIPCRVGTHHTYNILDKISRGVATMDDMALLEELCDVMKNTSLCGLGQSAPNPVLSTLRYFKDEYLAHIKEKKCPAGVCFPLTPTLSHGERASSEKGAQ
jgi:bidirectional [NiFe] hydrogenase diaphorase subunit